MAILEQYRVADLIEWHQKKQLLLNPHFQRRGVWSPAAKVYLIDTVLRGMPIPKMYMRTKVDLATKRSYREIVDGQQRLRAMIEFSEDGFALTKRAGEFNGLRYSNLDVDLQEKFLSYPIAVDQLVNASDDYVLEVFARLNSYNVSLNDPEKRHAKYQSAFKWSVYELARRWGGVWTDSRVLTLKQRSRMHDDSIMAELYGFVINGVTDGGEANITKLYDYFEKHEAEFADRQREIEDKVTSGLNLLHERFGQLLADNPLASRPHYVLLFSAVAHALFGIPRGQLDGAYPDRNPAALTDDGLAMANLARLGEVVASEEAPGPTGTQIYDFWVASLSNAHRIKSRKVRFPILYSALLPHVIVV